ncbi:MAG: GFA family protein [Pseudomonadota bacterium]
MPTLRNPHPGACHCGAVRFEVSLTDGLNTARRCNCSLCRMRGGVAASAPLDGFHLLAGADHLRLYQFNTKVAEHWFCGTCGIYTHHRRRSNPEELGINIACLEGVSPFDLAEVEVVDGVHHPSDGGGGLLGVLRFGEVE